MKPGEFDISLTVKDQTGKEMKAYGKIKVDETTIDPVQPPPTITCPTDVSTSSSDGTPVTVIYPAPKVYGGTQPVVVSSIPVSGSAFPVGSTVVTSTVTDADGRKAQCSFSVSVKDDTPPDPPSGVLSVEDLEYLGCFALPDDFETGRSTGTSYGAITLRRVDGELRIITTGRDVWAADNSGNWFPPDPLYEIAVPSTLYPDANAAMQGSRAEFRNWWDATLFDYRRLYNNKAAGNSSFLSGLLWDEKLKVLWLSYKDVYGINANDPSLIMVDLEKKQSGGAWRTTAGSHHTGGFMTTLPVEFSERSDVGPINGKYLVLGSAAGSGMGQGPWGVNAHVMMNIPDITNPADPVNDRSKASIQVQTLVVFDINSKQPVPAGFRRVACESLDLYNPGRQPDPSYPINPVLPVLGPQGSAPGSGNTVNDYIFTTAWINSESGKQAVLFGGHFVDGVDADAHAWYGQDVCVHGLKDWWHQATGPGATTRRNGIFFYSQDDFAKCARGELAPNEIREYLFVRMRNILPSMDQATVATGSMRFAFDKQESELYLSEAGRDWTNIYAGKAIIHKFKVK
jgi:hypothetical protein